MVQEAAYSVVDPSNLVFLFFLALQRIAGLEGFGFGSGFDSDWLVVDSASFVGYAVAGAYVVMVVGLVLAPEDVLVDHVMSQVFLDQVVLLVLALVPVLAQAASASALDHVQVIAKQSSCSADSHLLDFPSMKRPW